MLSIYSVTGYGFVKMKMSEEQMGLGEAVAGIYKILNAPEKI